MSDTVSDYGVAAADQRSPRAKIGDASARLALRLAEMIQVGHLTLVLPNGSTHDIIRTATPQATFILRTGRAIRRIAVRGNLGVAEGYIDGDWDSPDPAAVMALAAANEAAWEPMLRGRPWVRAIARLLHRLRPNTRTGARRNIEEHYDLGNDFYAEWLDPGMTYSAGCYDTPDTSLSEAQHAKIHRLCQALELQPGMTLLEIGCGWGSFAEIAARDYGAQVTGITLSPSQLAYAQARIAAAGLADRVTLELRDYRDVTGSFDRIASIEMFEAVGETWWPTYFAALRDRLTPGGVAGLQVITIADRLWADYVSTADFIQRYIFPGGMLPSPSRLRAQIAKAGLHWKEEHWFGQDYARTLAAWQTNFQAAWPTISRLAPRYDARFKRLWEYYLSYCETGFRAGWTDVGQFLVARPA
jgi:cyclopropane-fatty-acyl-phospholipid synthase